MLREKYRKGRIRGNWRVLSGKEKALFNASLAYTKPKRTIVETRLVQKLDELFVKLLETRGMKIYKRGFEQAVRLLQGSGEVVWASSLPQWLKDPDFIFGSFLIELSLKAQVDEIIVVDCGSVDKTIEVTENCVAAVSAKGDYLPVRIIQQDNADEGAAIRTLIAEAKMRDADALVLVEANGEYDPADIPKLLDPIATYDADLVLGSRFTGDFRDENKKKLSFAERVWARTLNFVANISATTNPLRAKAFTEKIN